MKSLIILRGVSGSGKTTFANIIEKLNPSEAIVCSADDYFMDEDGGYNFDASRLGVAHAYCEGKCEGAMQNSFDTVIIANTNVMPYHFAKYELLAKKYDYYVFHIVVENRHGSKNVHNVQSDVLNRQKDNLYLNIKL